MSSPAKAELERIGFELLKITRPEKVLFPNDGITKGDVVEYYERIVPAMLPYLNDHPVSMERYPDGIAGRRFVQKKTPRYFPDWIRTESMPGPTGSVRHVICDDSGALAYLASQSVITVHTWLSRADKPNYPDQLIFDLDPPADDFEKICETAERLRDLLKAHDLTSYVKTTGSRGLHVTVFLEANDDFDDVRAFADAIAQQLAADDPNHLTTEVRKNRRGNRILVNTARNAYAETAVAPYSVRALDGAPVAVPLAWEELEDRKLRPRQFNLRNVFDRIANTGDPWKGSRAHRLPRDDA